MTFTVISGPNQGDTGTDTTDSNGEAIFTYTGDGGVGTDVIQACYTNEADQEICSQTVTKVWNPPDIPYDITLTPEYDLNLVGEQHTVTATITGSQVTGIEVIFTVISGPNTAEIGTATTNANGEASITYTGNGGVGTDRIQACFVSQAETRVFSNNVQATVCSNVVEKEWTEEIISLSPLQAQNNVGTDHTVTATIQDLKGNPIDNVEVRFKVKSGPNIGDNGTGTTDGAGEATFTYTGDGGVGTDVIQACFTNAAGQEVCTDYEGRVGSDAIKEWGNPCPAIEPNPDQLPNAVKGQPYSQQFTGFGGTSPYTFEKTSGDLPPGLSPLTSGGLLSGTPTQEGTFTFTIRVTDDNGCTGSRQYTLYVGPEGGCPTITLSPVELPDTVKGQSYSQQFTASGGTGPYTFEKTSGNLPDGLSLTSAGLLSGTPTQEGTSTFTITVTDDNGCTGSRQYTLYVGPEGGCPTITLSPAELPNAVKNKFYRQQFTASGGTSPYTFEVSSGNLPDGLSLTSAGLLSGTPTQEGISTFTITVTDDNGCTGSRQYTLRVCPGISLSPDTGPLPDGMMGEPYSQTITASVASATFQLTGDLPPGLVGTEGSYVISGTPTQAGTWTFTITGTTAEGCSVSKDYTIRILDVIPTVTEWGMIVLALGLAAISVIIIRRRQMAL